jgi:hypothetical protein
MFFADCFLGFNGNTHNEAQSEKKGNGIRPGGNTLRGALAKARKTRNVPLSKTFDVFYGKQLTPTN